MTTISNEYRAIVSSDSLQEHEPISEFTQSHHRMQKVIQNNARMPGGRRPFQNMKHAISLQLNCCTRNNAQEIPSNLSQLQKLVGLSTSESRKGQNTVQRISICTGPSKRRSYPPLPHPVSGGLLPYTSAPQFCLEQQACCNCPSCCCSWTDKW